MRKSKQRGGEGNIQYGITIVCGILITIFSIIVPVLASMKYELVVKILTPFYGGLLFLFSLVNLGKNVVSTNGSDQLAQSDIEKSNIFADQITSILLFLISVGIIVTSFIYKKYSIFFPITFGLIGVVVFFNIVVMNKSKTLESYPVSMRLVNLLFIYGSAITLLILAFQQMYVNSSGC